MMRRLAICLAVFATPAPALDPELLDFHDLNRPASLEFDPTFCGLWIADEGPKAVLMTLDGLELRRLSSALPRIKAIAIAGNDLLVADGYGSFQRLSKDGTPLGDPFRLATRFGDTEGIVVDDDGSLIVVEDEPGHILWMTPTGEIIHRVNGWDLSPAMTEPQGIARDERTGRLLVVDDWEGTNSLFEFAADGNLLATHPLIAFGRDPDGIAIRAATGMLFIAFGAGARIAAFEYTPTEPVDLGPPQSDCMFSGLTLEKLPV